MAGNRRRGIVLQDRDRHLLSELGVMRIIDREMTKVVAGFGSTTRANARLLQLTRAGLLRRFFVGSIAHGRKAVYTLSPKGSELVNAKLGGIHRASRAGSLSGIPSSNTKAASTKSIWRGQIPPDSRIPRRCPALAHVPAIHIGIDQIDAGRLLRSCPRGKRPPHVPRSGLGNRSALSLATENRQLSPARSFGRISEAIPPAAVPGSGRCQFRAAAQQHPRYGRQIHGQGFLVYDSRQH